MRKEDTLQWGSISQKGPAGSGDLHNKKCVGFNKDQCEVLHLREGIAPTAAQGSSVEPTTQHESAECPSNQDQQPTTLYVQQMVGSCIMHHSFFFSFTLFSLSSLHLRYSIFISVIKLFLSQPINFTIFHILAILLGLGSGN